MTLANRCHWFPPPIRAITPVVRLQPSPAQRTPTIAPEVLQQPPALLTPTIAQDVRRQPQLAPMSAIALDLPNAELAFVSNNDLRLPKFPRQIKSLAQNCMCFLSSLQDYSIMRSFLHCREIPGIKKKHGPKIIAEFPRPWACSLYNRHMGGVDLNDQLVAALHR